MRWRDFLDRGKQISNLDHFSIGRGIHRERNSSRATVQKTREAGLTRLLELTSHRPDMIARTGDLLSTEVGQLMNGFFRCRVQIRRAGHGQFEQSERFFLGKLQSRFFEDWAHARMFAS